MPTKGGFGAFTERAKDVIVQELRSYLSLNFANVLKEMPQIERYGLAGQTSAESFVNVFTALPHEEQRIPFIAIMSAPGTERKMGIGRQVIQTFHDPDTGLPTVRECVGGDLNVIIEIVAVDTNTRSELTDIVFNFFATYAEQTFFSFLGDTTRDEVSGVPQLYQLIIKSQATLNGETDQPRPEGEPFNRIYFNRITVPIIFIDYVDREANDISICYNPNLTPDDDDTIPKPLPFAEPGEVIFAAHDDFEDPGAPNAKWFIFNNSSGEVSITNQASEVIRGSASVLLQPLDGTAQASLVNRGVPVLSGKLRARFRLADETSSFIIMAMMQGPDPYADQSYQLIVKSGQPTRLALRKGTLTDSVELGEGTTVVLQAGVNLAAQLEWKIDTKLKRIRLRGHITKCDGAGFGELVKRVELIDATDAFLSTTGEGFGFAASAASGSVVVDDVEVLTELNIISQSNPARVSP